MKNIGRILVSTSALLLALASTAGASSIYLIQDDTRNLVRVDPVTLATTVVGNTGIASGKFGDLAYDEGAGVMYWAAGRDNNSLYTIDLVTGAATLVGAHGINDLFTLGHNGSGLFGQSTGGGVYSLNSGTATATLLGRNAFYPGGYDWNATIGQMVLSEAASSNFYSVDLTTGAATLLGGPGTFVNDNDVAYDAIGNQYWQADYSGNLYRYDAAFNQTLLLSNVGSVASIEYVSDRQVPVPEPASMILVASGLAGLIVRYRRRSAS